MQINQHNYEEFFLMYVDNELSVQEKEMVDAFLIQNPELAGELELLKQTVLDIGEPVNFAGKEKLIKQSELTEADLLTYLDGEAGKELTGRVEQEAMRNNTLKLELDTLGKLYLKADTSIKYPAKEKLYKRGAVRSMDWRKLAIAASLLLCVSTWLVLNQSEQEESGDAPVALNTAPVSKPVTPESAVVDTHINDNTPSNTTVPASVEAIKTPVKQNKPVTEIHQPVSVRSAVQEPLAGKTEVMAPAGVADNGSKTNPFNQPADPVKVTPETIAKSLPVEPSNPVVSATEPVKEKKSLFKKIGKQISDRALDILSDGGDNINVAGFAIRVEK